MPKRILLSTAICLSAASMGVAVPLTTAAAAPRHVKHHHKRHHKSQRRFARWGRLETAGPFHLLATVARPPKPTSTSNTISSGTAPKPGSGSTSSGTSQPLDCVYSALSEATLAQFNQLVGTQVNCVQVYNNVPTTWADWTHPWFLNNQRDADWARWATSPGTHRQLIITQSLIPTSLAKTDWRTQGATGAYADYAKQLSANLVAAGLGSSIIRLAAEMNGDWNIDNVGTTSGDMANWIAVYRSTVLAMKSVPGAHFTFDWSVNAAVRPLPLSEFYPGNDVVDVVGIDAYDQGVASGAPRWSTLYNRTDGIGALLTFAQAHNKPLSIPEWGLAATTDGYGGGDDPSYVQGIGNIVQQDRVAYQCYFFKGDFATQLISDPSSLAMYIKYFG